MLRRMFARQRDARACTNPFVENASMPTVDIGPVKAQVAPSQLPQVHTIEPPTLQRVWRAPSDKTETVRSETPFSMDDALRSRETILVIACHSLANSRMLDTIVLEAGAIGVPFMVVGLDTKTVLSFALHTDGIKEVMVPNEQAARALGILSHVRDNGGLVLHNSVILYREGKEISRWDWKVNHLDRSAHPHSFTKAAEAYREIQN